MYDKKNDQKKIIVVGAGIAGIAAYQQLIKHGFEVKILEARDRAGGRIWTDDALGIPFGRGAGWIHGAAGNPIAKLANHFNAKMVPVSSNKFSTFDQHGKPIPHEEIQKFNAKFEILLKKAKELAYNSKVDISLFTAFSRFIKSENLSSIEQSLFETKLRFFEGYIGADYKSLSARHWDQEEAWPGDNCFLTSSYQPIIEGLLKNCPVQLNTIVTEINLRENDIALVTENSVLYADAVIITVPLGVLKKNRVIFDPPLPAYKQKAIQQLGMGLFNILAIKFPSSFWPTKPHALVFTSFDALSISVFFNLYHFIQQPIIVGFTGGETARQLENLTDTELIEKTMNNFKKVFGSELPDPELYLNTRWSRDPFCYGSYTYVPTGSSGSDYEAMSRPISNKLFFAGEATCRKYPATTHGAYLSGIREANRIINLYP